MLAEQRIDDEGIPTITSPRSVSDSTGTVGRNHPLAPSVSGAADAVFPFSVDEVALHRGTSSPLPARQALGRGETAQ